MLCALTVRKLKPGTFDQFREAFMGSEGDAEMPAGSQFFMVRNTEDPDEVICFGLFNGTLEELRSSTCTRATRRNSQRSRPSSSPSGRTPCVRSSSTRLTDRHDRPAGRIVRVALMATRAKALEAVGLRE
jgi:hypothetical protein